MTTKRRAEIQRRLSLAPLPTPPAGLADRIKSDIPHELRFDVEQERARLRQGVAFNIRVAASIILLISSVYLALHLLSRSFAPTELDAVAKREVRVAKPELAATRDEAEAKQSAQAAPTPVLAARGDSADAKEPARATPPPKLADAKSSAEMEEFAHAAPPPKLAAARDSAEMKELGQVAPPQAAAVNRDFALLPMLNVEVCVAPFDPSKNIVRVTTPKAEVKFNEAVVASSRRVSPEVYEIVLRRRAREDETIATVRAGGMEQIVRRADVRAWRLASREMKSASLTLALDERDAAPEDVAAKARAEGLDDVAASAAKRRHP